jgi:hypothetical protein
MPVTVVGFVLGPLLLLFVAVFVLRGKGRQGLLIGFAVLFFLTALYQLIVPMDAIRVYIPQVLWKLITLATVAVLFVTTMRDKQFIVSSLIFVQSVTLILAETLLSPDEPTVFLQFQYEGELLLVSGAFALMALLPGILSHLHRSSSLSKSPTRNRAFFTGIFLLMAAFAGILSARSITGLFLFGQWGVLADNYFQKAFDQNRQNAKFVLILQQSMLTIWIGASVYLNQTAGSLAMEDLSGFGSATGLVMILVLFMVLVMGRMIPEKVMARQYSSYPTSIKGLSVIMYSLLIPFSVLLKFRPLFINLDNKLAASAVFLGGILMAANAYYAGVSQHKEEILSHMVLFVSGWAFAAVFTGLEGIFFTFCYVIATAASLPFLFACVTVKDDLEEPDQSGKRKGMVKQLSLFKAFVLLMFLFAPFSSSLLKLVVVQLMAQYPLAMLLAVAGLVFMTTVVLRWLLDLLREGITQNPDARKLSVFLKCELMFLFVITVAVNLLSGTIYRYLQSQSLPMGVWPAADIEKYASLPGILHLNKFGTGVIFLVISIIIMGAVFIVYEIYGREKVQKTAEEVQPFKAYSLTAWLPSNNRIFFWIRAGWIATMMLLVGVALSCFKA